MNNLLSQLLVRLAQKEVEERVLQTRIESLELLVSAVISTMDDHNLIKLTDEIDLMMTQKKDAECGNDYVRVLLQTMRPATSIQPQE